MLDRFQLLLILRNQVSDRALRRRALAVEAVMEQLAPRAGLDVEACRIAGLGCWLDAQMCVANPDRRGALAAEYLATEGAPDDIADAVRQCYRESDVAALSPLAALRVIADAQVGEIYEALADEPPDAMAPVVAAAGRVRGCLQRLHLAARDVAVDARAAVRGIREEGERGAEKRKPEN